MIRINLLGEKADNRLAYLTHGFTFFAVVLLSLFSVYTVHDGLAKKAESLQIHRDTLARRLEDLKKKTEAVNDLERKRARLREKLTAIAKLKAQKHGPVHVLSDLNDATPSRAWLTEIKETGELLTIEGVALDNQTVASFMQSLQKSSYFDSVDLEHTTQVEVNRVKLKQFRLLTKVTDQLKRMEAKEERTTTKEPSNSSS